MTTTARTLRLSSLIAALALVAALPSMASAQSSLDSSQATAFMGSWALNMESDQGAFAMSLQVTDNSGKVAASIGAPELGGLQSVTNITKSGNNLVLRYEIDAQGQIAPVTVTLVPNGAALNVSMDFADGMFVMSGTGTK